MYVRARESRMEEGWVASTTDEKVRPKFTSKALRQMWKWISKGEKKRDEYEEIFLAASEMKLKWKEGRKEGDDDKWTI